MSQIAIEEIYMSTPASTHYDSAYFDWQKEIGKFGGWANVHKFVNTVRSGDTVADFGCGGGFLVANLQCARRIGIEPNPSARANALQLGVDTFARTEMVIEQHGVESVDLVVSTNALEHALHPLLELEQLHKLLRPGGRIHFVVPCESLGMRYVRGDINRHLYSWSPQCLGNLFEQAGFEVDYVRPYIHKWPPFSKEIAKLGWPIFNIAARIWGQLSRSWFQVEILAHKPYSTNK